MTNKLTQNGSDVDMSASKAIVKALQPYTRYAISRFDDCHPTNVLIRPRSCDVADALIKLKVPHGGFLPGLTMWSPKRQEGSTKIIGPAYTVKYVRKNYENEPKPAAHYVCLSILASRVLSLT